MIFEISTFKLAKILDTTKKNVFVELCYRSNYDALLHKSSKPTMEVKMLHTLVIEIFKILSKKTHRFMREIFYQFPYVSHKNRI